MSLNALPETLTNPNFCFMSRDIPDEKHASSFQTYSLNVAPLQRPIFWIWVSKYPASAKALAPPLCSECVFTLAGNVSKCVCRLHPSNDRHFCLSPTCWKCRPDTPATFSYVGQFFGCQRCVSETCCRHTLFLPVRRNQY